MIEICGYVILESIALCFVCGAVFVLLKTIELIKYFLEDWK